MKPLKSVDLKTKEAFKAHKERSDVTAVPALSVICEAVAAPVIANAVMAKFGGDNLDDILMRYNNYKKRIEDSWMDITIEYCVVWNYYPRAVGLANEIKKSFNINPELIKSSGGKFDVKMNDVLVFSKAEEFRFPEEGEVIKRIRENSY